MNNSRRKELNKAIESLQGAEALLNTAQEIIESCKNEEEEYRDNMPENLQGSEKYEQADNAVSELENAYDQVDSMLSELEEAISSVETASE